MRDLLARIRSIQERRSELAEQLAKAIERDLPVGTRVWYSHSVHRISAVVTGHLRFGSDILVRGRTGREYRLCVSRIEEAHVPEWVGREKAKGKKRGRPSPSAESEVAGG
jgi:hypothetical protein